MAEAAVSAFVMQGARDAIAAGLSHIDEQVAGIERAVVENPGLAFDLAKTLVESVCRAVLSDLSIAVGKDTDLPTLFKTSTQHLSFLPPTASAEAEVRKSLQQTLNGLHTALQGICELRNQCGFASHGSAEARPAMEAIQALLAAEAADAIVGFLHRVHLQDRTVPPSARAIYDEATSFNAYVDEEFGVIRVFEAQFPASEVLFQLEPETYRVYLAEFDEQTVAATADAEATDEGATA